MKKSLASLIVVSMLFLMVPHVWADMIRMKNGKVIEGTFLGGSRDTIRFETDKGILLYKVEDILSITFLLTSSTFPKGTPTPQSTPLPPIPKQQEFTIKNNTRLSIRMVDSLDTGVNRKGDWFDTTLEASLVVHGVVVVPRGTTVRGQVVESEQGKNGSALVITLRKLLLKQQVIPITTTNYGMWDRVQESSDTGKTLRRGRLLQIPSRTSLGFQITEPVTLSAQPGSG